MPLYEYQCDDCSRRFERIQKFSDPPVDKCPACNGPVHRLVSSPAIQFKGSGWYITDYAKKSGDKAASADKASKPAESTSDSKGSETKPSTSESSKPATGKTSDTKS